MIAFVLFSRRTRGWFVFFAILFISDSCYGQKASYSYEILGTEEGLASSEVYTVIEDSRGYLWFGTDAGVSRYDGYEFTNYTVVDGLIDNTIFKLHEDNKGRIWCMGFRNGICYIQNDRVHPYRYNKQLTDAIHDLGWISNIVVDSNETIRFNLSPWGYGEINNQGIIALDGHKPRDTVVHRIVNSDGSLIDLICDLSNSPVRRLTIIDRGIKRFDKPLEANPFHVYSYPVDSGAYFFNLGTIIGYIDRDTILVKHLPVIPMSFNRDDKGRVWIAYLNKGIAVYNSVFDLFDGRPPALQLLDGFNISKILNQPGSGMWLSLENRGVCHIYNYDIENYFFDAVKPNGIPALAKNDSNELFLSVPNGDFYKINAAGTFLPIIKGYSNASDIYVDEEKKKIYVATFDFRNESIKSSNGYEFNYIHGRGIKVLNDSSIWVLSPQSLQLKVNNETTFKTEGYQFLKTIFKDEQGTIWLGGNGGFFKMENRKLISCNALLGLENKQIKINKIRGLKNGTMMIATKNDGLLLLSPSKSVLHIPFKEDVILDMYLDDDGELWIGTNNGIIRLKPNLLGEYSVQRINHLNGLSSNQINCINGIDDFIYAGTENGLVRFNKREVLPLNLIPKLSIQSISVNGDITGLANDYQLSHDQNNIEFFFSGRSHDHSGNLKYRYKLKGADENWLYTGNRIVRYPSLAPGDYQFKVAASNGVSAWSDFSQINITINKPWWKTTYFILALIILGLTLVFSIYFLRLKSKTQEYEKSRQIEEQKLKLIEAKLVALRSQMNPHFTFNSLNAIQNVLVNFSVKEAINYMSNFSTLIRGILENSEKFYMQLDEELEMLKLYVDLENLRFGNTIDYQVQVDLIAEESFIEIPSMILQPFIENAIIHGLAPKKNGDRKLILSFKEDERNIYCTVQDSGIGRKAAKEIKEQSGLKRQSFGIKIAEERLKLLAGGKTNEFTFHISDLYDQNGEVTGTKVTIKFKKGIYVNENN
ncbi:MAG: hypothetical protein GQ574_17730 [Crocinitomix sp.]|nr:hypothetical protein [Crocinitomix sp.]